MIAPLLAAVALAAPAAHDWTRFGHDAARSSSSPYATGITFANAGRLQRQRVELEGTADSSPIFLHGVVVAGARRDAFFVTQPFPNHNGGELQFGPDKLLYVGMGDGGSAGDPGNRAQNLSIRLGKLMRTNPYVRRPSWRIVGYGLRNPWRFSFDSANGDLYIGDVGQNAWEEVDYRPRSQLNALANYGWNVYEGRARYRSAQPNGGGQLVPPVFVYDHGQGCSITGGYVYRGRAVPSAAGRYYFGDYCSGTIWSLRMNNGSAAEERREPGSIPQLTTFGVDNARELYAGTSSGRIYRLSP